MNHDHVSIAGMGLSVALLVLFPHPLWYVVFLASFMYGGWRLGQRLMPAESAQV